MGRVEEQAAFVAAVMEAAGLTELFVPMELFVGFGPASVTIAWHEDMMRDGIVFRLIRPLPTVDGEVVEERKEIEP